MNEQEQIQNHINQLNQTINQLDQDNHSLTRMLLEAKNTNAHYRQVINQLHEKIAGMEQSQNQPELTPVSDPVPAD